MTATTMAGPVLEWSAGQVPVSTRYADPFFNREDGLAESRHVFLAGNDLPARFRPGFHIAELGFGTGLNLLAALHAWRVASMPGKLLYTGFELDPLPAAAMARALASFPAIAADAAPMLAQWSASAGTTTGTRHIRLPDLEAAVVIGDARHTLLQWRGQADAWFLDGFAPARNPQMWDATLLAAVATHTAPEGSFATYTAAGHVRRALEAAGFVVMRRPGFGRKRHMSSGRLA